MGVPAVVSPASEADRTAAHSDRSRIRGTVHSLCTFLLPLDTGRECRATPLRGSGERSHQTSGGGGGGHVRTMYGDGTRDFCYSGMKFARRLFLLVLTLY
jgi:hypothetical protein